MPDRKSLKNRLHLDLKIGGGRSVPIAERRERVDAKAAELSAAGAQIVSLNESTEPEHDSVLVGDPEGKEFCVL